MLASQSLVNLSSCVCVRVLCRRVDAATANRVNLTREEVELIDVAAEMEQQLLQQYTQVHAACFC